MSEDEETWDIVLSAKSNECPFKRLKSPKECDYFGNDPMECKQVTCPRWSGVYNINRFKTVKEFTQHLLNYNKYKNALGILQKRKEDNSPSDECDCGFRKIGEDGDWLCEIKNELTTGMFCDPDKCPIWQTKLNSDLTVKILYEFFLDRSKTSIRDLPKNVPTAIMVMGETIARLNLQVRDLSQTVKEIHAKMFPELPKCDKCGEYLQFPNIDTTGNGDHHYLHASARWCPTGINQTSLEPKCPNCDKEDGDEE